MQEAAVDEGSLRSAIAARASRQCLLLWRPVVGGEHQLLAARGQRDLAGQPSAWSSQAMWRRGLGKSGERISQIVA